MSDIKKKKGISHIISITLMILIVTLSIGIIYINLQNIVESPLSSPKLCKDIVAEQLISIKNPCYNQQTNSLEITLTKRGTPLLKSLMFELDFDNETKNWKCNNKCGNCKILGQETKTYHIFPNRLPEKITIIGNECYIATRKITTCQT